MPLNLSLTLSIILDYLDVDQLRDFDTSEAARAKTFEDLVIPTSFRTTLVALVDDHASGNRHPLRKTKARAATQIDLVRGKGRGLIILLHGPPGTGKTSTAETIAAYRKSK